MGVDIHVYCEVRCESGNWVSADLLELTHDHKEIDNMFSVVNIYDGRDYEMFSMLSGQRGESARFGCVTENYGIPEDCCDTIRKAYEYSKTTGPGYYGYS